MPSKINLSPKQGIFYDGQVYDAYVFVSDLIKSANESIVLIDNYIDDTILTLFLKEKQKLKPLFTPKISLNSSNSISKNTMPNTRL